MAKKISIASYMLIADKHIRPQCPLQREEGAPVAKSNRGRELRPTTECLGLPPSTTNKTHNSKVLGESEEDSGSVKYTVVLFFMASKQGSYRGLALKSNVVRPGLNLPTVERIVYVLYG